MKISALQLSSKKVEKVRAERSERNKEKRRTSRVPSERHSRQRRTWWSQEELEQEEQKPWLQSSDGRPDPPPTPKPGSPALCFMEACGFPSSPTSSPSLSGWFYMWLFSSGLLPLSTMRAKLPPLFSLPHPRVYWTHIVATELLFVEWTHSYSSLSVSWPSDHSLCPSPSTGVWPAGLGLWQPTWLWPIPPLRGLDPASPSLWAIHGICSCRPFTHSLDALSDSPPSPRVGVHKPKSEKGMDLPWSHGTKVRPSGVLIPKTGCPVPAPYCLQRTPMSASSPKQLWVGGCDGTQSLQSQPSATTLFLSFLWRWL